MSINEAIRRLNNLAIDAISQYNQEVESGGEPVFPAWTADLCALIEAYELAVKN